MEQKELTELAEAQARESIIKQIVDPFNLGVVAEAEKEKEKEKEVENKDVTTLPLMNLDLKDNPYQKLNEATGFEFKAETEVVETLKKFKDFEEREKSYLDDVTKGKTYIEFLETLLPEELKAPIVAFAEDRDWKAVAKQMLGVAEVDYSKSWGDYEDHVPLIQKYNPDLSQEDWEALEEKQKNAYINLSKSAYTKERTDFQKAQKADIDIVKGKLDKRAVAIKSSIEDSIADLKKNYPNLTEQQVSDVRSIMYRSPTTNIVQQDGTYTKDAATRLAFAHYGTQTYTQAIKATEDKYKAEMEKQRKELGGKKLEEQVKAANDKVPKSDTKESEGIKEKVFAQIDKFSNNKSNMFVNKNSH
jgi:hypothetical protein